MLQIRVNDKDVKLSIARVKSNLENRRPLLEMIGARLVAYTRQTIFMQGRGKAWKPLSPLTTLRTGRTLALITLTPYIKYSVNNRKGVRIYFSKRPKNWSIEMHERGFTSPAVKNKFMKAPGLGKFSSRRKSVIPARKIFPGIRETQGIAGEITRDWARSIFGRSWR